jgi:hypothetical protein
MSDKHEDYDNRRTIALARYKDGLCLLENGKYFAAFYMFGFVLEIGIQANLYLIEEEVLKSGLKSYLFNSECKNLKEFFKKVTELEKHDRLKIIKNKEPQPNKDEKNKGRHNLVAFINQRNDALEDLVKKNLITEAKHTVLLNSLTTFFKDWNPNDRYEDKQNPDYKEYAQKAKNASRIFLKKVLGYEESEIPDFVLNEVNKEEIGEIKKTKNYPQTVVSNQIMERTNND